MGVDAGGVGEVGVMSRCFGAIDLLYCNELATMVNEVFERVLFFSPLLLLYGLDNCVEDISPVRSTDASFSYLFSKSAFWGCATSLQGCEYNTNQWHYMLVCYTRRQQGKEEARLIGRLIIVCCVCATQPRSRSRPQQF